MNIALVGNDGRANALRWHFEKYGHKVVTFFSNSSLGVIVERAPFDLVILVHVEDSANGLQEELIGAFGPKKVFACSEEAARFETSKFRGVDIAIEHGLNVPQTNVVRNSASVVGILDMDDAVRQIENDISGDRYVIKREGLACGQGVVIVRGSEELRMFLALWRDGRVLVQKYKEGIEISAQVLCQRGNIVPLWTTMEHKRAHNDDRGCMTAEMGTVVLAGVSNKIMKEIRKLEPWLRKVNYTGVLDVNFIMDESGDLWFVEPTCRWGDPETEIAMPMLGCDFAEIALKACVEGNVSDSDIVFDHKAAVGVVVAGGGYPYPNACLQGMPIELPEKDYPHVFIMSAEKRKDGSFVTKGGRHLVVVGTGESVESAKNDAYRMVRSNYWFLDAWYRTDIGTKFYEQFVSVRAFELKQEVDKSYDETES